MTRLHETTYAIISIVNIMVIRFEARLQMRYFIVVEVRYVWGPYKKDTMATHDICDYLRFDIRVVPSIAHKTSPHYSQMTRLHETTYGITSIVNNIVIGLEARLHMTYFIVVLWICYFFVGAHIEDTIATHNICDTLRFDIRVVSNIAHYTSPHFILK
jgi:hypothetical protein